MPEAVANLVTNLTKPQVFNNLDFLPIKPFPRTNQSEHLSEKNEPIKAFNFLDSIAFNDYLRNENKQLQVENKQLQAENQRLQAKQQEEIKEVWFKYLEDLKRLTEERKELNAKHQKEIEEMKDSLWEANMENQKKINEMKDSLWEANMENVRLKTQCEGLKKKCEILKDLI